jgi:ABC-type branched-subunit amino acid transport system substrate-binding protein
MHRWRVLASLAVLTLLTAAAQAQDGVSPRQILIGQTITLQGGQNEYGVAVLEGIKAYVDQVNRQGGVLGRQLVIKVLDDDNKSSQAEANARQLVTQDKVFLLFGSIEGGPSTAVMKAALDLNVPFFGPMAGSPMLRTPHQPGVFPVRAEHKAEFRALLAHARSLGVQRVAFLRADSETGQQHLDNVTRLTQELDLKLVADLPFKSDVTDAGIDALVAQLARSQAQMVFNHGGIGVYEKLIRKARAQGLNTHFYGVNSGSTQLAKHLAELAHGMIFAQVMPSPWERKTAVTRAYQEAFTRAHADKPFSYGSLEGYVTARALVEALKLAGPNPTRAGFVAGLRNSSLNIEGLRVNYGDTAHAGLSLVDLSIVTREGSFRH